MTKLIIECDDEIARRWEACLDHFNKMVEIANQSGANFSMNMSKADALLLMGIEGYENGIESVQPM